LHKKCWYVEQSMSNYSMCRTKVWPSCHVCYMVCNQVLQVSQPHWLVLAFLIHLLSTLYYPHNDVIINIVLPQIHNSHLNSHYNELNLKKSTIHIYVSDISFTCVIFILVSHHQKKGNSSLTCYHMYRSRNIIDSHSIIC